MKQDIYTNKPCNYNVDIMQLANEIASRVKHGKEFFKFTKEHMKWIIDEMDKM